MLKRGIYFISGIDTDAGKSYATGILARQIMDSGKSVTTQKFIQTGGVAPSGLSIDIEIHRKIMGIEPTVEDLEGVTCPVIFSYPASPHLASEIDGKAIDYDDIKRSTSLLSSKYDILLIEGAGGLHVPLEGFFTTIDYVAQEKLPLVFITSGKLGSINHTLLSLEACKSRGIEVAMVIYNRYFRGEDGLIDDDTFKYISNYLAEYWPETQIIEISEIDL